MKRVGPILMSSNRPTQLDCLHDLGEQIREGPWDGLGDMVKTKVTLDIMHGKEHTMT